MTDTETQPPMLPEPSDVAASDSMRARIASVVAAISILLPCMALGGFFGDPADYEGMLTLPVMVGLGSGGGAVTGALYVERRPVLGAACGVIFGLLSMILVPLYVEFRSRFSSRFFIVELLLPMAVSALPAWGLYALVKKARPNA